MKYVPPSVRATAFNCPHCEAYTTQFWHSLLATPDDDTGSPPKFIKDDVDGNDNEENPFDAIGYMVRSKEPFLEDISGGIYSSLSLQNVNISRCYNCFKISIWIYNKLVYPQRGKAPQPNPDLPDDIKRDYLEASAILDISPRGAAALVRLCIQKLCIHLKVPGNDLNTQIGTLVKSGLDPRIQKALDAVRVIGNNAVHPGRIDLRDDREIAESLFGLLNVITEKIISQPKHIDALYNNLPEGIKNAIKKRDSSAS